MKLAIFPKNNLIDNPSIKEIFRFLIVGLFSTIVNYLVFLIFLDIIHACYIFANWVGYFTGVALSYLLNSKYTFRAQSEISPSSLFIYILIYSASLIISTSLLFFLVEKLRINPKLANLFVILQSTITNYLGCKFIVFKK